MTGHQNKIAICHRCRHRRSVQTPRALGSDLLLYCCQCDRHTAHTLDSLAPLPPLNDNLSPAERLGQSVKHLTSKIPLRP